MIADKLIALARSEPPDAALAMMRLSLCDWIACGRAGANEPVSHIIRDMVLAEEGAAQSSVFGSQELVPARGAALVNGAISHALDYDDTHFAHIGHPSVVVLSAAVAIGEAEGASGDAVLRAGVIGAEASIRFGQWLGRAHYQAGFHQTATAGAFGAAIASGLILGLNDDQMGHALSLVATKSAGLKTQFGTMGKPYNAGLAAATGVETAQLAARGMVSNPVALDDKQGFGPTHFGEGRSSAFASFEGPWRFETISHKFHACCHGLHAMLECIGDLRAEGVTADKIKRIEIETNPRWITVCNIPEPKTGLEAKFSYRLTAAMAVRGLSTGALDTYSDDAALDPELIALRDKVEVLTLGNLPETAAEVRIEMEDGQTYLATHDLDAPMSLRVRSSKLQSKAVALIGKEPSDGLWAEIAETRTLDLAAVTDAMVEL